MVMLAVERWMAAAEEGGTWGDGERRVISVISKHRSLVLLCY